MEYFYYTIKYLFSSVWGYLGGLIYLIILTGGGKKVVEITKNSLTGSASLIKKIISVIASAYKESKK